MGVLQTRLQRQIGSGNPSHEEVQAMEDHLRRVQLQNTRLQGAHDSALQALHSVLRAGSHDPVPTAGLQSAHAESDSSKLQLGCTASLCLQMLPAGRHLNTAQFVSHHHPLVHCLIIHVSDNYRVLLWCQAFKQQ